jgi:hypothetical protein
MFSDDQLSDRNKSCFPVVEIREYLPATFAYSFFDMYIFLKNLGPKQ